MQKDEFVADGERREIERGMGRVTLMKRSDSFG